MAKITDKVVSNIYETYDYEKFSILAENRGQKETKGIKERKLKTLQTIYDSDAWVDEFARVRVNEKFEIVDGAHTFEILKRNAKPIRYEIITDEKFNEVPKREMIGAVYGVNSVTTSWNPRELFAAATQVKAPLALLMAAIIEANDNYFLWTDLMALLEKDSNYFFGRWRKVSMKTFERKELIEQIQSEEFKAELKHFVKLNLKARIAFRKGIVLKAAYDILWHCGEMVDKLKFRKSLASIPEALILSSRTHQDEGARRMLISHYNKSQGDRVEITAVNFAVRHKSAAQPVEMLQ